MKAHPDSRTRLQPNAWNICAALLSAFCISGCASSAEPAASTQQANATQMREQIEQLTHRSSSELQVTSDGTTEMVDLRGGYRNVTIVRQNPEGGFSGICTDSAEQALEFWSSEPAPKPEDR